MPLRSLVVTNIVCFYVQVLREAPSPSLSGKHFENVLGGRICINNIYEIVFVQAISSKTAFCAKTEMGVVLLTLVANVRTLI